MSVTHRPLLEEAIRPVGQVWIVGPRDDCNVSESEVFSLESFELYLDLAVHHLHFLHRKASLAAAVSPRRFFVPTVSGQLQTFKDIQRD